MKIAHFVEATATGTLSMLIQQANYQSEQHEVCVFYARRPETPSNLAGLFSPKVKLVEISLSGVIKKVLAIARLRNALVATACDAVFLHSSIAGFIGRLACAGLNKRVYYFPHCISFMRKDLGVVYRLLCIYLERLANRIAATYVACSNSEAEEICREIPRAKVKVIENAVDLDFAAKFSINRRNEQDGDIIVVTVGQIRPQKGPIEFANIARAVLKVKKNVQFRWIGAATNSPINDLRGAGVSITGWQSREQVYESLSTANIYLSTALWEGMPVGIIEAQAVGLPTVASSCSGNVDVIQHEITGILYFNLDDAIERILKLIDDAVLRERLGNAARSVAGEKYSVRRYRAELDLLLAA